jgi:hypothetical protein
VGNTRTRRSNCLDQSQPSSPRHNRHGGDYFFAPIAHVDAGPLAKPDEAAFVACTQRPWPYLNFGGILIGNPRSRLLTTDHRTP